MRLNHKYIFNSDKNEMTVVCRRCDHVERFRCTKEQADMLEDSTKSIQEIFPDLDAGIAEMFISGDCACCYELDNVYFPEKALTEIIQCINDEFHGFLDKRFTALDNDDIMDFLLEAEDYDGIEKDGVEGALKVVRKRICDIAEGIWNGDYDEDAVAQQTGPQQEIQRGMKQ